MQYVAYATQKIHVLHKIKSECCHTCSVNVVCSDITDYYRNLRACIQDFSLILRNKKEAIISAVFIRWEVWVTAT